jgi:hypothetical protein
VFYLNDNLSADIGGSSMGQSSISCIPVRPYGLWNALNEYGRTEPLMDPIPTLPILLAVICVVSLTRGSFICSQ